MLLVMLDPFLLVWGPRGTSTSTVADQSPATATVIAKDTSTATVTGG